MSKKLTLRDRTFLIVEDSELASIMLADFITESGGIALASQNVQQAVTFLRSDSNIDCMILDLNLGAETGFDVLDIVVKEKIPVKCIAYSQFLADAEYVRRLAEYGIAEQLSKPAGVRKLTTALSRTTSFGRFVCSEHNTDAIRRAEDRARQSIYRARRVLQEELSTEGLTSKDRKAISATLDRLDVLVKDLSPTADRTVSWRLLQRTAANYLTKIGDTSISEITKHVLKSYFGIK